MTNGPNRGTSDRSQAAARLHAQLLGGPPATSAEAVVRHLLAVQAQDARGARLALRSRSTGLTAADVDHALTTTRSLVVATLNRGTLHLVTAADYWWLHPLTTPQLRTLNQRRLREEGVDEAQAARGIDVLVDALERHGPQTRNEVRARLEAEGVPVAGQALAHIVLAASLAGFIVRGPLVGAEHAFAFVPAWLGQRPPPIERDEALGRLAQRYLRGHAPAGPNDLAKWAGITLGEARRAFGIAAASGVDTQGDCPAGRPAFPPPRLLGAFDPLLLGWASRDVFVGAHKKVVTTNGLFRPVALVDGRVVATWRLPRGVVTVDALDPISQRARAVLARDAADVLRFLGLPANEPAFA